MRPFIIAQISDMHVKAHGGLAHGIVDTADALRRCIDHVLGLPQRPDVALFTGDLVDAGADEEYEELRRLLAPLTLPSYLIPGNHDDRDALRRCFPDHRYLRQWAPYVQYVVEDWPLRLVALDTVVAGQDAGRLCDERLDWLDRTLAAAPHRPTLVFMHHPPFRSGLARMDQLALESPERLAAVVSRHPQVQRVVCGHVHRSIQTTFAGIATSVSPATANQLLLDLTPGARTRLVLEPPGYQLHLWDPSAGIVTHTVLVGDFPGPYDPRA